MDGLLAIPSAVQERARAIHRNETGIVFETDQNQLFEPVGRRCRTPERPIDRLAHGSSDAAGVLETRTVTGDP
jgi:hypothetical protein